MPWTLGDYPACSRILIIRIQRIPESMIARIEIKVAQANSVALFGPSLRLCRLLVTARIPAGIVRKADQAALTAAVEGTLDICSEAAGSASVVHRAGRSVWTHTAADDKKQVVEAGGCIPHSGAAGMIAVEAEAEVKRGSQSRTRSAAGVAGVAAPHTVAARRSYVEVDRRLAEADAAVADIAVAVAEAAAVWKRTRQTCQGWRMDHGQAPKERLRTTGEGVAAAAAGGTTTRTFEREAWAVGSSSASSVR